MKERLPHMTTSMCIYQLAYSCRASNIGCFMLVLSKRVREHYPEWLCKEEVYWFTIRSAITVNTPINTSHSILTDSLFTVILHSKQKINIVFDITPTMNNCTALK
uniref:Uncharacterized protein n=1 Tax=Trichobilharzia regenti TaxID=157069 RepID=A0AA85IRU5_TRIRE|nr:unnamed protein product [Trichobilharzia regenti]